MKWFKHNTNVLQDPDMIKLIDKYGSAGYFIYFGLLELIASNYTIKLNQTIEFPINYLKQVFKVPQNVLIGILTQIKETHKIPLKIMNNKIVITYKKIPPFVDEYTRKQLKKRHYIKKNDKEAK